MASSLESVRQADITRSPERPCSDNRTLILIKPDGMRMGVVGGVLTTLKENDLVVERALTVHVTKEWAEELYQGEEEKEYFEAATKFISREPVTILVIAGTGAVNIVKHKVVGKYPNGIRRYGQNPLENVAHAPDSPESAQRELELVDAISMATSEEMKDRLRNRKAFILTGMSESGKSTIGMYLNSQGIPRLKIGKIFDQVRRRLSPDQSLDDFIKDQEKRNPFVLWDEFINELIEEMDRREVTMVSMESLYGGGFGPYLKQVLGKNACIIYREIPLETRLIRQMEKPEINDPEAAKQVLIPRDEVKERSGIPELKGIADVVIGDFGTVGELHEAVDAIIRECWDQENIK